MELNYKITAAASRWAIMYTLFAIGVAISAGLWLNEKASTPESLRGVCPALIALGTCALIASRTIRGHHAKDVEAGKQAVKDKEFAEKVANTAVQLTNEAKEAYSALKSEVGELQTVNESALKECERMRGVERTLVDKLQTLKDELANANKEIANAKILHANAIAHEATKLANAKEAQANAIANAVAEVKKNLAPTLKLGKLCLEYRQNKSLGNTNGIYKDNAEKRAEYSQKAKDLNVQINEHIESL